MKTHPCLIMIMTVTLAATALASAQVAGSNGGQRSPEEIARSKALAHAEDLADKLLAQKQWGAAVRAYEDFIALTRSHEPDAGCPRGHYGLARAYMGLEKTPEALVAFRKSLAWRTSTKDLYSSGDTAIDYAFALLKADRLEDAKAIYYAVLRLPSRAPNRAHPFLVVFDPEPGMTVWPLTKLRLEAALLMLTKLGNTTREEFATLDRVQAAAPEWIYPAMFRALYGNDTHERLPEVERIYPMATNDEEQVWIERWRQYMRVIPRTPQETLDQMEQAQAIATYFRDLTKQRLKNSTVLEAARVAMERDPLRLVGRIVD